MPKKNEFSGLFRGIMLAHLILFMHVLLIAGVGILVIFFKGVLTYLPVILFAGFTAAGGSAYYLYRRLKTQGRRLRDLINSPVLSGKSIEISLLGGVASVKIGSADRKLELPVPPPQDPVSLPECHQAARQKELIEIAKLLENERIDPASHNRAKRNLNNWKN
jgi:hypothetical protein